MERYDHKRIEKKWQEYWERNKTFKAVIDPKKPKYYILDMFPYPSGAGLHVGHVTGYTGSDILARYMRQKGYNVLHPMGWDSFGLPAEQYAIRTGTHPKITTEANIRTYRRQLKSLGFSYDWDREITTSDPHYYKWTQWIFTKLYEKGLAYEAEAPVNFCPALGTVLANEEVEEGKSKEGRHPVERRPLRQWILKITEYAERLLQDLKDLDWPDHIKQLQTNWIGKSEGAKIIFSLQNGQEVTVFTTRPDTLLGVTYLVLAPEHPLVGSIASFGQQQAIEDYRAMASSKSELQRTDLSREKTGVWTGSYAVHPVTKEKIPVWLSDYVLIDYGTGAVMGVPFSDERDKEFAKKFHLPIKNINGGKVEGIPIVEWLEKNKKGSRCIGYKLRDWLFSRQRYWGEPFPILHFADGTRRALDIDELPLMPPQIEDYSPLSTGESPLAKDLSWVHIRDAKTNKEATRETNTMPQWAGSCWYYLRFLDPNNDQKPWSAELEKYWMPVDLYIGGVEHANLHLLYARFWHKVLFDLKLVHTHEPFLRLRNQGLVTSRSYKKKEGHYLDADRVVEENGIFYEKNTGTALDTQIEKMSKSKLNGIPPDNVIEEFGADSLRLYEMFMGPFDKEKVWNTDAVSGCRRFLNRFYEMAFSEKVVDMEDKLALKLGHLVVHKVWQDIEAMQFNTAIAHMMEFMNDFTPLAHYPKKVIQMFTQALYPFAPHIAEEVWEHLGKRGSLAYEPLPKIEEIFLQEKTATYVIQVNGRLRGRLELEVNCEKQKLLELAKKDPNVSKHLVGEIVSVVYVPNKLLNIVLK